MKRFTPRQIIHGGMKEALTAAANGEDVYIVPGRGVWCKTDLNPRAVHAYGEKVAATRFKLVRVDDWQGFDWE